MSYVKINKKEKQELKFYCKSLFFNQFNNPIHHTTPLFENLDAWLILICSGNHFMQQFFLSVILIHSLSQEFFYCSIFIIAFRQPIIMHDTVFLQDLVASRCLYLMLLPFRHIKKKAGCYKIIVLICSVNFKLFISQSNFYLNSEILGIPFG